MGTLDPDFTDDVVVITGASSGIGRAVALAFGDAGAVVLNADVRADPKDPDASTPTHEAIENAGGVGEYLACDVSDPDAIRATLDLAREYGGVDVWVNNAGFYTKRRFREVTPDEFEAVHEVNARGTFFGTQLAANDMIERGVSGSVVNTASTTQGRAEWDHSHYAATKGAIRAITRSAALELAPHDVRVNGVAPGPVATEIREGWSEEAESIAPEGTTPSLPLRAATPVELSGAYLFLASDLAEYVTGETIWVDGGAHVT